MSRSIFPRSEMIFEILGILKWKTCEWTASELALQFKKILSYWPYLKTFKALWTVCKVFGCRLIVSSGDSASVGLLLICLLLFLSICSGLCLYQGWWFFSNVSALSLRPGFKMAPVHNIIDLYLFSSKFIYTIFGCWMKQFTMAM